MKKFFSFLWEIAKIVIISLAIVIPIRYYIFQPFFVKGASMEPSFDNGEYLIIDEISKRLREFNRGEVIVFKFPKDPSQYYIKRIIGLPEETVKIKDGNIYIYNKDNLQGLLLDESPYLLFDNSSLADLEIKLGQDEYFILGDNRPSSSDSRRWGPLPEKHIVGRVFLRAWPPDRFGFIENPQY